MTTHQVEEVQNLLTHVVFVNHGRIVLSASMEAFDARYSEVMVMPELREQAIALGPIHERQVFGRSILMFDGVDRALLMPLGEIRTPSIADLFVAVMSDTPIEAPGAAA